MSLTSFDLGGGGNSFSFDQPGDSVTGKIVVIEEQQQTDMQTSQPAVWENGQPKMMVRVELQTELRDASDPSDDGRRSVFLKGSKKPESGSSIAAVIAALQASTGARTLQVGGTLTLTYTGDGVQKQRGFNPPKLYTASYVAPSVNLGQDQATAAPAVAQPAAAPAPAAPSSEVQAAFETYMRQQGQQAS